VDGIVAVRMSGHHGQVAVHSGGVVEQNPHNHKGLSLDDVVDQSTTDA
jgi:hypothetical protein